MKQHFPQPVAMFVTFLLSSVAHELVMSCITHKMRWYGFSLMMTQLPIVSIQKMMIFKGHKTLKVSIDPPPVAHPFRLLSA